MILAARIRAESSVCQSLAHCILRDTGRLCIALRKGADSSSWASTFPSLVLSHLLMLGFFPSVSGLAHAACTAHEFRLYNGRFNSRAKAVERYEARAAQKKDSSSSSRRTFREVTVPKVAMGTRVSIEVADPIFKGLIHPHSLMDAAKGARLLGCVFAHVPLQKQGPYVILIDDDGPVININLPRDTVKIVKVAPRSAERLQKESTDNLLRLQTSIEILPSTHCAAEYAKKLGHMRIVNKLCAEKGSLISTGQF